MKARKTASIYFNLIEQLDTIQNLYLYI